MLSHRSTHTSSQLDTSFRLTCAMPPSSGSPTHPPVELKIHISRCETLRHCTISAVHHSRPRNRPRVRDSVRGPLSYLFTHTDTDSEFRPSMIILLSAEACVRQAGATSPSTQPANAGRAPSPGSLSRSGDPHHRRLSSDTRRQEGANSPSSRRVHTRMGSGKDKSTHCPQAQAAMPDRGLCYRPSPARSLKP